MTYADSNKLEVIMIKEYLLSIFWIVFHFWKLHIFWTSIKKTLIFSDGFFLKIGLLYLAQTRVFTKVISENPFSHPAGVAQ